MASGILPESPTLSSPPDVEEYPTSITAILCSQCQSAVSEDASRFEALRAPDRPCFPHHESFSSFQAAITAGCYICVRVRNRLDQTSYDLPSLSESAEERAGSQAAFSTYTVTDIGDGTAQIDVNIKKNRGEYLFCHFGLYSSKEYASPTALPRLTISSSNSNLLSWFNMCNSAHKNYTNCHTRKDSYFTPARILEIGAGDNTSTWRLVEPKRDAITVPAYTTLSYCWGDGDFIKLTSSTEKRFRSWTPRSALPQVFQDAMAITRQMQVRYIWIDAFCIFQDSKEDFHRQCTEMSNIYSNTTCTIAAAYGGQPDVSLSSQRMKHMIQVGRFVSSSKSQDADTKYMESPDSIFDIDSLRETRNARLFSRGWVLQELLLSPRTLYFSQNQVHWICGNFEACDLWPYGNPYFARGLIRDPSYRRWSDLVEKYSCLSLSRVEDKLVALSGLAKSFQISNGDEYFAGHWRKQLEKSLNWAPKPYYRDAVRSPNYIAPSWSWASIEGGIYSELPVDYISILCDVRDVTAKSVGVDPKGQLESGRLTLAAPSINAHVSSQGNIIIPDLQSCESTEVRVFWSVNYVTLSETNLQLALTYAHHVQWSHVISSTNPWYRELEIKGILLARSHSGTQDYERVGTLSVGSTFGQTEVPPQDGLTALGLQMNAETREITAKDKTQYREFCII